MGYSIFMTRSILFNSITARIPSSGFQLSEKTSGLKNMWKNLKITRIFPELETWNSGFQDFVPGSFQLQVGHFFSEKYKLYSRLEFSAIPECYGTNAQLLFPIID